MSLDDIVILIDEDDNQYCYVERGKMAQRFTELTRTGYRVLSVEDDPADASRLKLHVLRHDPQGKRARRAVAEAADEARIDAAKEAAGG